MSDPEGSSKQYQARLEGPDGTIEITPIHIPDGFWTPSSTTLHYYRMSGWQETDDSHAVGTGNPAYRVAYKTLKVIPSQDVEVAFPNLRVRVATGSINRGGVLVPDGLPGRQFARSIVPEYGMRVTRSDGAPRYVGCPDRRMRFSAWSEDVRGVSYVEILYRLPSGVDSASPDSVREIGRSAVAPLKTILDVTFGFRLLGILLLEEIGEVFDDWHWNRRLDSTALASELQLSVNILDSPKFLSTLGPALERSQSASENRRRRFRLASRWYWLADAEEDGVNRFIQLWLVVESLEMTTTDISPVKRRLASLLGDDRGTSNFVGRLFGRRSALVHGDSSDVTVRELEMIFVLARVFLASRSGVDLRDDDLESLQSWVR